MECEMDIEIKNIAKNSVDTDFKRKVEEAKINAPTVLTCNRIKEYPLLYMIMINFKL